MMPRWLVYMFFISSLFGVWYLGREIIGRS